jgi:hypothetical protein
MLDGGEVAHIGTSDRLTPLRSCGRNSTTADALCTAESALVSDADWPHLLSAARVCRLTIGPL